MTILTKALSAIGLGAKPAATPQPEATDQRLRQMTASRDDWKELAGGLQIKLDEANAKFKLAATDLAKQAEEIGDLRGQRDGWRATAESLRPDAQKWRDSLKRSRDRKAAKKDAPARDKRAKNRGGGK